MAKYMKGTMNKLQQFTTKEFNEKLAPIENLAPPSHTLELLKKKVEGLEKIACMFNGMAGLALAGLIAAALRRAFNRKKKKQSKQHSSVSNIMQLYLETDGLVGTAGVRNRYSNRIIGSRVGMITNNVSSCIRYTWFY